MPPTVSPPVSSTRPPLLWEMGEYQFQDFCRALWMLEAADCQHYGVRGQAQFGVDLLSYREEGQRNEVGQCKCYRTLKAEDVKAAADKFYKNRRRQDWGEITRFVLFTACAASDTRVLAQIRRQKTRFKTVGIKFEVWDDGRLLNQLRPAPDLVRRFVGEPWVPILCTNDGGGRTLGLSDGVGQTPEALFSLVGMVAGEVGELKSQELDRIREALREGRTAEAVKALTTFQSSRAWGVLPVEVRGRALRLAVSAALDQEADPVEVGKRLNEAKRVDPQGNFCILEALMAYRRSGVSAALVELGEPDNSDAHNLWLALRLAGGNSAEVIAATEGSSPFPTTPETWRVRAMALLMERRVEDARSAIQQAFEAAPEWRAVRQVRAMVDYCASAIPAFRAWGHFDWPVPPAWFLVKRDAGTLAGLRRAASAFERLADEDTGVAGERAGFEAWRLGCLANDPERQEEAADYARALLGRDPACFPAAIWALERGYSFDQDAVRTALNGLATQPEPVQDALLALVTLQVQAGEVAAAESVLRRHETLFARRGMAALWGFTLAQVLANDGRADEAKRLADAQTDPDLRASLEATLLRTANPASPDLPALAAHLEQSYERTRDAETLLACGEAKMAAGEPGWVADHAGELLRSVPTAPALRLALAGAWNSGRSGLCLSLLENHADLFTDGRIPADLRRLQVEALRRTGRPAEAVRVAEEHLTVDPNKDNLAVRFNAYFSDGDLRGCAHVARLMLGDERADGGQLLQAARLLAGFDRALAVYLWREAVRRGQNQDPVVLGAIALAHQLGLEQHTAPLMARLPAMAVPGGPVRALSYREMVAHLQERARQYQELNVSYQSGTAPIHLLASMGRHPLADLYHGQLEANRRADSPLGRAPLLIRHGSREGAAGVELTRGGLVLDVTAVLLAADLGLLDVVEETYAPLHVSAHLPVSLLAQIQQLPPDADDHAATRRTVLDLVASGRVEVIEPDLSGAGSSADMVRSMGADWCDLLQAARTADGLLVDYVPLRSRDGEFREVRLDESENAQVVSIGELLTNLRRVEQLTGEDLERCATHLGEVVGPEGRVLNLPPDRRVILAADSFAPALARAGVMERIARHCKLTITAETHRRLRAEAETYAYRVEMVRWLSDLLDRVRAGITSGRYVSFAGPELTAEELQGELEHPDVRCFRDLLHEETTRDKVVWCDDRFATGFQTVGPAPLVGTFDVLQELRRTGALGGEAYFERLLRLRAANVRFLPVDQEEILHHLTRAPVNEGQLTETPALSILRRSVAACLMDGERAQRPTPAQLAQEQLGELNWMKGLMVATVQAAAGLWREGRAPEEAAVRADWLLANLHVDVNTMHETLLLGAAGEHATDALAGDIASFFGMGMSLPSESPVNRRSENSPRFIYYRWVETRLLEPHLKANPSIRPVIGQVLSDAFAQPLWQGIRDRRRRQLGKQIILGAALDLPPALLDVVELPAAIRREFGVVVHPPRVEMLGCLFETAAFWRAVADAVNGRSATITDTDGGRTFTLGLLPNSHRTAVAVVGPGLDGTPRQMSDPLWPALADTEAERRDFLRSKPEVFDCPAAERESAINAVAGTPEAAARIGLLDQWRQRSAEWYYRSLRKRLRGRGETTVENFVPGSAIGLASHLRLTRETPPDWEVAATALLAEEGLEAAVVRFAALPRALPQALLRAFGSELPERAQVIFSNLEGRVLTPLGRLHLLSLGVERCTAEPAYLERMKALKEGLLKAETQEALWPGFQAILRWTFEWFRRWPELADWSPTHQLALGWLHAARVHNALLAASVRHEAVAGNFSLAHRRLFIGLTADDPALWLDVASPAEATWASILGRGLGAVIQRAPEPAAALLRLTPEELLGEADDRGRGQRWLHLMMESRLRTNGLDSFLGGVWAPPLAAVLGPETFRVTFVRTPEEEVAMALSALEENAGAHAPWISLWVVLRLGPIHPSFRARLEAALRQTDLTRLLHTSETPANVLIPVVVCSLANHSSIAELKERLQEQLFACARHLAELQHFNAASLTDDEARVLGGALLDAVKALTQSAHAPASSAELNRVTARIIQLWPSLGTQLRETIGAAPVPLPLSHVYGAWPLLLAMRASP